MKPVRRNLPEGACRDVGDVLASMADKWSIFVIVMLADGGLRFNELRRAIENISQKMLTATLRNLERDGFVTRTVTPTRPVRVDYELTPLGREALVPLEAIANWAIDRSAMVHAARAKFDERQEQR
jgi:DNA-binding HxlR family transcriptional regulator